MSRSLLIAVLVLLAAPALRADESCYTRTYDDAHLKKHPEQRVQRARLSLDPALDAPTLKASFSMKDTPGWFGVTATCKKRKKAFACSCKVSDCGLRVRTLPEGRMRMKTTKVKAPPLALEGDAKAAALAVALPADVYVLGDGPWSECGLEPKMTDGDWMLIEQTAKRFKPGTEEALYGVYLKALYGDPPRVQAWLTALQDWVKKHGKPNLALFEGTLELCPGEGCNEYITTVTPRYLMSEVRDLTPWALEMLLVQDALISTDGADSESYGELSREIKHSRVAQALVAQIKAKHAALFKKYPPGHFKW